MKPTQQLHDLGQSLWLDNITRGLLTSGTLRRYIDELSITGLTSNPSIFDHAIKNSNFYDDAILQKMKQGKSGETLFFELAIEDLMQAADLFRPIYDRTNGIDGWVSIEVSPMLAHDTPGTIAEVGRLHARAERPNLFVKIPGTPEGVPAIEESIFAGVPVNVTLLFSCEQYLAAAEAYLRGIERRIQAGLNPDVCSLASVFISRWDKATMEKVPGELRNKLGIAVAKRTYKTYRQLLDSDRWLRLANAGARPQRLLWASTGTKDPTASDVLYIKALAAPFTVNTIPDKTLLAFADHGSVGEPMAADGGDADEMIAKVRQSGHRLRQTRHRSTARSCRVICKGLERDARLNCIEERRIQSCRVGWPLSRSPLPEPFGNGECNVGCVSACQPKTSLVGRQDKINHGPCNRA